MNMGARPTTGIAGLPRPKAAFPRRVHPDPNLFSGSADSARGLDLSPLFLFRKRRKFLPAGGLRFGDCQDRRVSPKSQAATLKLAAIAATRSDTSTNSISRGHAP